MARHIAKNVVASGLCDKCQVQLAYAIGMALPVSLRIDTFGANVDEEKLSEMLDRAGAISAATQIARRMLDEARQSLETVPVNRYVTGLQAISDHLIGLIGRLE